jgi:hypothetical protein
MEQTVGAVRQSSGLNAELVAGGSVGHRFWVPDALWFAIEAPQCRIVRVQLHELQL